MAAAKKKPFPGEEEDESDLDPEDQDPEDQDDASSSQAPPEKMKGNKPHPLRRWARDENDAARKGLIGGRE